MNKLKIIIFGGSTVFIFLAILGFAFSGTDLAGRLVTVKIDRGLGIGDIAALLKESDLLKSKTAFTFYSLLSGSVRDLKAGSYLLTTDMSVPSIVKSLVRGPVEDIEVLVREGDTLAEVEAKLVRYGILKKNALIRYPGKSLEGFLFPDTYRFFPNSSPKEVVEKFLKNFNEKALPILSKTKDLYNTLIVASMIEKEVPFLNDRYLVAGIIYKRLSIQMPLQIDAAPETYNRLGLPTKPIANPGITAIKAAANPLPSSYLYYLSDPKTKKTIFSNTFNEHKENKWKYLGR